MRQVGSRRLDLLRQNRHLPFVKVIVVVTSVTGWVDRRERIRKQFARNLRLTQGNEKDVVLKFALGTQGVSNHSMSAGEKEAKEFQDILFLDCIDVDIELQQWRKWRFDASSSSTTSKVMLSAQWAVRHYTFDYFFRLGDDSYLRIDAFLYLACQNEWPRDNAVVGHILTTNVFGMQQIYPQGMGYALTYDVTVFIGTNSAFLLDTAPEDCVVARWLFAIGANFIHSPLWRDIELGQSCHPKMVLAHKLPANLWTQITADGLIEC